MTTLNTEATNKDEAIEDRIIHILEQYGVVVGLNTSLISSLLDIIHQYGNQRELEGHRYPTREDAQKFAEAIAASDTGLGGWLTMSHSTNSFASLLLQFANPMNYLTELQSQQAKEA